jgi:hypothetical protein
MNNPASPQPPSRVNNLSVAFIIKRLLLFICLLAVCSENPVRAQDGQPRETVEARNDSARDGVITGRVVSEDGRPLADVSISIYPASARGAVMAQTSSTDTEGRFRVAGLSPGVYFLQAALAGYALPQAGLIDGSETIYYRPGDSANITLMKGGVITGTVKDANGEPVVAIAVRALRVRDASGRSLSRSLGYAQFRMTDDRGIYRIYGLQPGTYLVTTGGTGGFFGSINAYEGDAPTYYPSSTRDTAAEVTVRGGEEVTSIDIRYRGERGHTVSGQITGSIDSGTRAGVSIVLKQAFTAGVEATTFAPPGGKQGFAFNGVADGEYEVIAQQGLAGESTASIPRRVTVKGADVTGLELTLAPLASISGRFILEPLQKENCADKSGAKLVETLITARRDEKGQPKEAAPIPFFSASAGVPDAQGDFLIRNLMAGSYRLATRLPSDVWYMRSIVLPGTPAQRPPGAKAAPAETKAAPVLPLLTLKTSEKLAGVTIQIGQDGANLSGRVVAASEEALLPANLKIYLVPAERERAEDVLRYDEAMLGSDGSFALKNLAPGRYWLIARPAPDESTELAQRPLAWNTIERAKLRREAEAVNTTIELKPCQRTSDYSLRYAPAK